ncbi:MAG: CRTAC1 family protein [Acidobacteriaceae bacterium]
MMNAAEMREIQVGVFRNMKQIPQLWRMIVLLFVLCSCWQAHAQNAPSPSLPKIAGKFTDITEQSGVHFLHRASHTSKKYLLETMGSGVALFDYDNDGRLDLFLVNGAKIDDPEPLHGTPEKSGPEYYNRLYHQRKDGTFEDVTLKAGVQGTGYGMGVAVGDYDNDGYEDLYVTGYGHNTLYHNNGNGTFTDVTMQAGVEASGWSSSAIWFDFDNDGKLDLIVGRYLDWDFSDLWCGQHRPGYRAYCHPDIFKPITLVAYHNDGHGHFSDWTARLGLNKPGRALGVAIADYDHDGKTDLFVANDSMLQFLYHNRGNGKFEEDSEAAGTALDGDGNTYAGMGVDFQDYNNDGWPDLVVTDLARQQYALYSNNGDGTFTYSSYLSGLGSMTLLHSGMGIMFMDYDNDGWKDIVVAQGHVLDNIQLTQPGESYMEPPLLAHNDRGKFIDVSSASGAIFNEPLAGRGLAIGDINNDGRMDFVISTNDGHAHILRNDTPDRNHWILLDLVGHTSNRDGIGAVVNLTTSHGVQVRTATTGGSYLSSSDKRVHFGMATDNIAKQIEIDWPSGIVQKLTNVKADQVLTVDEPAPIQATTPLLK